MMNHNDLVHELEHNNRLSCLQFLLLFGPVTQQSIISRISYFHDMLFWISSVTDITHH